MKPYIQNATFNDESHFFQSLVLESGALDSPLPSAGLFECSSGAGEARAHPDGGLHLFGNTEKYTESQEHGKDEVID